MKLHCSLCKNIVSEEIPNFCIRTQYIKVICPDCDMKQSTFNKKIKYGYINEKDIVGTIAEAENFIHNISNDPDITVNLNFHNVQVILNRESNFQKIVDNIIEINSSTSDWKYDLENAPFEEDILGFFKIGDNKYFSYICKRKKIDNNFDNWFPKKPIAYAIINTTKLIQKE